LVRHIRDILTEAIAAGGSTLQDYQSAEGIKGEFQQRFFAYDRAGEPCHTPGCPSVIKRIVQSGRSTFYCHTCQK
jgi:formamidopyrimidine-DNA glycosylase